MKKQHKITFRVSKELYDIISKQSNTISSSIRVLLQLALEGGYNNIFDPSFTTGNTPTTKYHISSKIDDLTNNMLKEYSSNNKVDKSEAIIRLIEIVLSCEGLS